MPFWPESCVPLRDLNKVNKQYVRKQNYSTFFKNNGEETDF